MNLITVSFTDENGRKRSDRFWLRDEPEGNLEREIARFKDAGYGVAAEEYHWVMASMQDDNRETRAQAQWVTHADLEAYTQKMHLDCWNVEVYEEPGKTLQQHILAPPREERTEEVPTAQ